MRKLVEKRECQAIVRKSNAQYESLQTTSYIIK